MNVTYVSGVHSADAKLVVATDTVDVATTDQLDYLVEKLEEAMDRIRQLESEVRRLEVNVLS